MLDDYTQDTKQLKITAKSKDDMTTKVLQEYKQFFDLKKDDDRFGDKYLKNSI